MAGRPKKVVNEEAGVSFENKATVSVSVAHAAPGYDAGDTIKVLSKTVDTEKENLRKSLDDLGIAHSESESVYELAMKLAKEAKRVTDNTVSSQADLTKRKLASYAPGTNLTDKDFLQRLYFMGVPGMYLKGLYLTKGQGAPIFLFNDMDHKLSDARIWERIRFSGVSRKSLRETMSKYSVQPGSKRMLTPIPGISSGA
jgi:hypothetical protein